MADVNGLLGDPEFNQLPEDQQRAVLGRIDPDFGRLSSADYWAFRQRIKPTVAPPPNAPGPARPPSPIPAAPPTGQTQYTDMRGRAFNVRTSGPDSDIISGFQDIIRGNTVKGLAKITLPMTAFVPVAGDAPAALDAVAGNVAARANGGTALSALRAIPFGAGRGLADFLVGLKNPAMIEQETGRLLTTTQRTKQAAQAAKTAADPFQRALASFVNRGESVATAPATPTAQTASAVQAAPVTAPLTPTGPITPALPPMADSLAQSVADALNKDLLAGTKTLTQAKQFVNDNLGKSAPDVAQQIIGKLRSPRAIRRN